MPDAPLFSIDLAEFNNDPYPALAKMRESTTIAYVPELDATLITRRDDIFDLEKQIDIFSSDQPEGLMTQLMGQNMMRKDGDAHQRERRAIFPTLSPKTVRDVWTQHFRHACTHILETLAKQRSFDVVKDFAMPLSGEALKAITGLSNMSWQDMDRVSQGVIDGCANYAGDPEVEAHCQHCTALIDAHISDRMRDKSAHDDFSLISVQLKNGLCEEEMRANVKLAISGGQNEPRDAIAGIIWALLQYPNILREVQNGSLPYLNIFEEFTRWIAPIGMSPRRIAKPFTYKNITFEKDTRAFLMFGSGNRDEAHFKKADEFDPYRNTSEAITFGAGPHFCAGAWAAKALIVDVALPMFLQHFPNLTLCEPVEFKGWAFRGPRAVVVENNDLRH